MSSCERFVLVIVNDSDKNLVLGWNFKCRITFISRLPVSHRTSALINNLQDTNATLLQMFSSGSWGWGGTWGVQRMRAGRESTNTCLRFPSVAWQFTASMMTIIVGLSAKKFRFIIIVN